MSLIDACALKVCSSGLQPDWAPVALPVDGADAGVSLAAAADARRAVAGVRRGDRNARHELHETVDVARDRQVRQFLALEHLALPCVLDVDQRRGSGLHGDDFRGCAELHFGVDRSGEIAGQIDIRSFDRRELFQFERDGVLPDREPDDLVTAIIVGDGRTHLFDQLRAGDFDGHARQHAALAIANHARNAPRLRQCQTRGQDQHQCRENQQ